jgi:hypothetical protein
MAREGVGGASGTRMRPPGELGSHRRDDQPGALVTGDGAPDGGTCTLLVEARLEAGVPAGVDDRVVVAG